MTASSVRCFRAPGFPAVSKTNLSFLFRPASTCPLVDRPWNVMVYVQSLVYSKTQKSYHKLYHEVCCMVMGMMVKSSANLLFFYGVSVRGRAGQG